MLPIPSPRSRSQFKYEYDTFPQPLTTLQAELQKLPAHGLTSTHVNHDLCFAVSTFQILSLFVAVFSDIWMIVKAMEAMDTGMEEVSQILMQLSQAQGDEEAVQILEGIAPILSTPQVYKSNISVCWI